MGAVPGIIMNSPGQEMGHVEAAAAVLRQEAGASASRCHVWLSLVRHLGRGSSTALTVRC